MIRVLFVAAQPLDMPPLDLKDEVRKIGYRIFEARLGDRIQFKDHWSGQFEDLTPRLLDKDHRPNIVHFSGHGTAGAQLVFANAQGIGAPVPQSAVVALFSGERVRQQVRCVVLNACYAEGLALELQKHIDFVIGCPTPMTDAAAIAFSEAFYFALSNGESLQTAMEQGCAQFDAKREGMAREVGEQPNAANAGQRKLPRLFTREGADPGAWRPAAPAVVAPALGVPGVVAATFGVPGVVAPGVVAATFGVPGVVAPRYRDEATRALGVALAGAQARKRKLEAAGASIASVNQEILEIRRKLRAGGQLREGDTLGRYLLLETLGSGGFATVWKAHDPERRGTVAIKVLHSNLARDETRRERFLRGAREMAGLDHPAIVRVLSPAEEDEGFHFFVMEYVDGKDLQHAVLKALVPKERALPIVLTVGEALAVAHAKGLVHRDVKPANILLGAGGESKLTDFDLVGGRDTTGGTRTSAMGSFVYAAPEMLERPQDADARADVFGLAMSAVFMLHGKTLPVKAFRHTDAFVDTLACAPEVRGVLKRALEWEPDGRFADASVFCAALRKAIAEEARPLFGPRAKPRLQAPAASGSPANPPVLAQPWTELGQDAMGRFGAFSVGGVVQRMRWIRPGTFLMGSPETETGRYEREGPQHEVVLTQGYWLAETPCTQAFWQAVMGRSPSHFKGPDRPVENVSWEDCQAFLTKVNTLVPGLEARLPTEAEWENACRGGTTGARWSNDLGAIAWYDKNAGRETKPVGQKPANPFGLHDMLGNVYEWCEDWFGTYPATKVTNPRGPETGTFRVLRGGSWGDGPRYVRAALRYAYTPGDRLVVLGFRLARGQVPEKGAKPAGRPRSGL